MEKMRLKKVKIPKVDITEFPYENLKIDDFWDDLYNPPKKMKKYKKD